jgi:hypothetical protein
MSSTNTTAQPLSNSPSAAQPMGLQRPKIHPLMFVPGALMWGLIITGTVTGNTTFIGIGVGVFAVFAAILITRKVKQSGVARKDRLRVWREGEPATAKIISIGTNGGGINDHPRVQMQLEIRREGRAPYQTHTSAIISKLAIPRIQPDCEIQIRIDPNDSTNVLVDAALTPYGYK